MVNGFQRIAGHLVPYRLASKSFAVSRWNGVKVGAVQVEKAGTVAVTVPPIVYPRTYASWFKFVGDDKGNPICKTCAFRPWAATGQAAQVTVRIVRANGTSRLVKATLGNDGVWHTKDRLRKGEKAVVDVGGVIDTYGESNGQRSAEVKR